MEFNSGFKGLKYNTTISFVVFHLTTHIFILNRRHYKVCVPDKVVRVVNYYVMKTYASVEVHPHALDGVQVAATCLGRLFPGKHPPYLQSCLHQIMHKFLKEY